ncbi:hypothetical protein OO013_17570 [Mangrovivirga sp. M17]|uniref:Uncharacterized protein n=1 Tax=Mangrovivirga halotolerans TaxID=2993936 RepID=A0ABT3RVM8_9BACT|nr:hypothetical protein [Mangrovivirga halotolerans]MCX2745696.1 hypothetical protein [Mangrovivirga halotolerans]
MKSIFRAALSACLIFIISCEYNEIKLNGSQTLQNSVNYLKEDIDPFADPEFTSIYNINGMENSARRTINIDFDQVHLDKAVKVYNKIDSTTRYSFLYKNNSVHYFDNLIIKEKNGEVNAYKMRYYPHPEWVKKTNGEVNMESFTGYILYKSLNNITVKQLIFNNGIGIDISTVSATNGRIIECTEGPAGGGTGDGGGHYQEPADDGIDWGSDPSDPFEEVGTTDWGSGSTSCDNVYKSTVTGLIYSEDCDEYVDFSYNRMLECDENGGEEGASTDLDGSVSTGVILTEEEQRLLRANMLQQALEENPYLLLDIDCNELREKWVGLAEHKPNATVKERVQDLNQQGYDIEMQYIENADGAVVNMDYFPVRIDKLPKNPQTGNTFTPQGFFEYIRKNFADICYSENSSFGPYNETEMTKWESSDYLGAVMRFDIIIREPFFNSIQIGQQDGSVLCTDQQNQSWIFSTVYTNQDHSHPVSGNREFGLITNSDGSYTFYTSGVDRIAEWTDDWIEEIPNTISAFEGGEELWGTLQTNLDNWINSPENGGVSTKLSTTVERIDISDLEAVLNGDKSVDELKCNN